ncbi:hypothetical protein BDV3_005464 [Batrachochytrium dendrobatidis]|uniref:Tyrosine specific protein phosphatases domain-containing protein n=1 Tax=Batrachochytrium dendrobatidis (strain JEL423) TaxID=403673 RepID=A0A177WJP4_BATDL|nr:hypothetical protein BDEG_23520 [Batrachochytrium dendrobatidis JEL423]
MSSIPLPKHVESSISTHQQRKWQQTAVPITHSSLPIDFLITDCPDKNHIDEFSHLLLSHQVSDVLRICDPSAYDASLLSVAGIKVHELYFEDGTPPTAQVVNAFRSILNQKAKLLSTSSTLDKKISSSSLTSTKPVLAIHCVSGIGRAPVLVCCALIDYGMDPSDAVAYVRKYRRGAINKSQLAWILDRHKGFKPSLGRLQQKFSLDAFKNIFSKKSNCSL